MNYLKWILGMIFRILPLDQIVDLIVCLMLKIAQSTDNKVDDEAVVIVATILYMAVGAPDIAGRIEEQRKKIQDWQARDAI